MCINKIPQKKLAPNFQFLVTYRASKFPGVCWLAKFLAQCRNQIFPQLSNFFLPYWYFDIIICYYCHVFDRFFRNQKLVKIFNSNNVLFLKLFCVFQALCAYLIFSPPIFLVILLAKYCRYEYKQPSYKKFAPNFYFLVTYRASNFCSVLHAFIFENNACFVVPFSL